MRSAVAVASAVLVVAGVGCSSSSSKPSAGSRATSTTVARGSTTTTTTTAARRSIGCRGDSAIPTGITEHSMRSGGRTRVYELDVPKGYDTSTPYALVFGLHALNVNYRFIPSMSGFAEGARYRFIGVSPSGLVADGTPYWDAAPTADNYDVKFIATLLDHLEAELCIDPSRVFSMGMSNGAQMSSLLACRLSTRITAIGAVSGEEFLEPCTGRPVPIIAFHGTADPVLPYKGGGLNATQIASNMYYRGHLPPGLPKPLGIDESMHLWARHNGCAPGAVEQRISAHVIRRSWRHCTAATEIYIVRGMGHSWPGEPLAAFERRFGRGTTEIDATKLMFRFFFGAG